MKGPGDKIYILSARHCLSMRGLRFVYPWSSYSVIFDYALPCNASRVSDIPSTFGRYLTVRSGLGRMAWSGRQSFAALWPATQTLGLNRGAAQARTHTCIPVHVLFSFSSFEHLFPPLLPMHRAWPSCLRTSLATSRCLSSSRTSPRSGAPSWQVSLQVLRAELHLVVQLQVQATCHGQGSALTRACGLGLLNLLPRPNILQQAGMPRSWTATSPSRPCQTRRGTPRRSPPACERGRQGPKQWTRLARLLQRPPLRPGVGVARPCWGCCPWWDPRPILPLPRRHFPPPSAQRVRPFLQGGGERRPLRVPGDQREL